MAETVKHYYVVQRDGTTTEVTSTDPAFKDATKKIYNVGGNLWAVAPGSQQDTSLARQSGVKLQRDATEGTGPKPKAKAATAAAPPKDTTAAFSAAGPSTGATGAAGSTGATGTTGAAATVSDPLAGLQKAAGTLPSAGGYNIDTLPGRQVGGANDSDTLSANALTQDFPVFEATHVEKNRADGVGGSIVSKTPVTQDAAQLMYDLTHMDSAHLTQIQTQMTKAGVMSAPVKLGMIDPGTITAYANVLKYVHAENERGNNISPDDYLAELGNGQLASKYLHNSTSTSSSTTVTSPDAARYALAQAMVGSTGRAPSQEEIDQFTHALNAAQQAHPSTTTSTTQYNLSPTNPNPLIPVRESSSTSNRDTISPDAEAYAYSHSGQVGVETNTNTVARDYYQAALSLIYGR